MVAMEHVRPTRAPAAPKLSVAIGLRFLRNKRTAITAMSGADHEALLDQKGAGEAFFLIRRASLEWEIKSQLSSLFAPILGNVEVPRPAAIAGSPSNIFNCRPSLACETKWLPARPDDVELPEISRD